MKSKALKSMYKNCNAQRTTSFAIFLPSVLSILPLLHTYFKHALLPCSALRTLVSRTRCCTPTPSPRKEFFIFSLLNRSFIPNLPQTPEEDNKRGANFFRPVDVR